VAGHERLTAAGVMRGKLGYAAPEQVRGIHYDSRADLLGSGITLYECLVGARLFRGGSDADLMMAVLEEPIVPPRALRPDVPPQLSEIVMGLLERELSMRTPSASELRRQLLELPRELLDLKNGRKLLAAEVANARSHVSEPTEVSSPTQRISEETKEASSVGSR